MPSTHDAFSPGTVVAGKYLVERQLAEGGIGIVVLATHLELRQRVAIKYLRREVLENPAVVERFKREAQLAASIGSDHVVRVFDIGTLDGSVPYIVMEYLEGEDLGAVVGRGCLSQDLAIDYVLQACSAIAEAHVLGIVHRDLKPENIFLARRGGGPPIIKILDFGISKAGAKGEDGVRLLRITENSESFGTPMYMSPEQLRSSTNVDSRADVWAIGVVLFELLTGQMPFEGQSAAHVGANILTSPARSLRATGAGVASKLEAVIGKCLEKDPAHRYRNVAELALALAPVAASASLPRVTNIQRIVLEGGMSIHPPRLSGCSLKPLAEPASPNSSLGPPLPKPRFALTRLAPLCALFIAAAGALLGAKAAVGTWLLGSSGPGHPAGLVGDPQLRLALEMTPPREGAPPSAAMAPPQVPLASTAPRSHGARQTTRRAPFPVAPIPSASAGPLVAPTPSTPLAAPPQVPTAHKDDNSEFGERK